MKKRFMALFGVGILGLGLVYGVMARQWVSAAEGFSDYLVPSQAKAMFFEKKVTVFLTTKAELPAKPEENAGWIVGFDTDMKKDTGGSWPKIGADYILTVVSQNGKWAASIKNVKTGTSKNIDGEVMVEKNKVDFSVPLAELENKTAFNWQVAVVSGDNKKALPDLLTADKKGQKDANYNDYMNKNMKM